MHIFRFPKEILEQSQYGWEASDSVLPSGRERVELQGLQVPVHPPAIFCRSWRDFTGRGGVDRVESSFPIRALSQASSQASGTKTTHHRTPHHVLCVSKGLL